VQRGTGRGTTTLGRVQHLLALLGVKESTELFDFAQGVNEDKWSFHVHCDATLGQRPTTWKLVWLGGGIQAPQGVQTSQAFREEAFQA